MIAAILLVTGESAVQVLRRFVARVGGEHHLGLLDVAAQTIRGVAAGIIFTAFLQAVLLVFGLVVVGAPGPVVLGLSRRSSPSSENCSPGTAARSTTSYCSSPSAPSPHPHSQAA